jgi:FdhD protein
MGPGIRRVRVRRWTGNGSARVSLDQVAIEEPLELRINGQSIAVMMRTPGDDEELVAGFLLSEGVVRQRQDIGSIRPNPRNVLGNVIDVILADGVALDLARLTRHVFGASSCGLCGKATLQAIRGVHARIACELRIPPSTLRRLPETMRLTQAIFGKTGGLHAAALFTPAGDLRHLREDVGRHNAVDKVLGRALLNRELPLGDCGLVVSGRASFEILQKALSGGVPMVAAVGAPSSLAVDFARENGQTLVGFLRDGRFNVYSGGVGGS